jgi:hypothetical protein
MRDTDILQDTKKFLAKQLKISFKSELDQEIEYTILASDEGFRNLIAGLQLKSWEVLCFQEREFYFSEVESKFLRDTIALRFSIVEACNHYKKVLDSGNNLDDSGKFGYLLNFYDEYLTRLESDVRELAPFSGSSIKISKIETSISLTKKELENYKKNFSVEEETAPQIKPEKRKKDFKFLINFFQSVKEIAISNSFRMIVLVLILLFSLFLSINFNLKYTFKYKKRLNADTMFSYSLVSDLYLQENSLYCEVNKREWENLEPQMKQIFLEDIKDASKKRKTRDIHVIDETDKKVLYFYGENDHFGQNQQSNGLR